MLGDTTFDGLSVGDWATWATAFALFLSFAGLVTGLLIQGAQRTSDLRRQSDLLESDQARKVGGYIRFPPDAPVRQLGRRVLELVVVNASELAVRDVRGIVYFDHGGKLTEVADTFESIPVVVGGQEEKRSMTVAAPPPDYILVLVFDDDAGITWRKYKDPQLKKLSKAEAKEEASKS